MTRSRSSSNDSLSELLNYEKVRYRRKGYGLFSAFLMTILFFYFTPYLIHAIYPRNIDNTGSFFFFSSFIFHEICFIISNVFMYIIYSLELDFFERYKTQDRPWPWKEDKDKWAKLLKKTGLILFVNQFIVLPLSTSVYLFTGYSPYNTDPSRLPNHFELITHITFYMICEDFFFYWTHRLLHWDKIYNYVHKIHHQYFNTISLASEYAHPIEFFFGNILPTSSGPLILGMRGHYSTYLVWVFIRVMESTDGHCGYEFSWSPYRLLPFSGSSEYHNYHHINYKGNYCSLFTFWDRLCGTVNPNFYKFQQSKYEKVEKPDQRNKAEKDN